MRPGTRLVHSSRRYLAYGSLLPPVYRSVCHVYPSEETPNIHGHPAKYVREGNPTVAALEELIASLEEGETALAFSSGMAVLSALLLALVSRGDTVIAPAVMYGGSRRLLEALAEKIGYQLVFTNVDTSSLIEAITRHKPRLVVVESIVNPTLYVFNLPELAKACREAGAILAVDNTAAPTLIKPLEHGATLALYSLTKYIAGHNDAAGGAVAGPKSLLDSLLWEWRRLLGAVMDPEQAYLIIRGAKTLHVRLERQSKTAMAVAEFLHEHPKVARVLYPGLPDTPGHENARRLMRDKLYGALISFEVKGGTQAAHKLMKSLKLITPAPSFGGPETLITHPATGSHASIPPEDRRRHGVTDGLLRLSIGLEDPEDIIEDLGRALDNLA